MRELRRYQYRQLQFGNLAGGVGDFLLDFSESQGGKLFLAIFNAFQPMTYVLDGDPGAVDVSHGDPLKEFDGHSLVASSLDEPERNRGIEGSAHAGFRFVKFWLLA
jgi:hypothetical protein